jgi:hypothetical protein
MVGASQTNTLGDEISEPIVFYLMIVDQTAIDADFRLASIGDLAPRG